MASMKENKRKKLEKKRRLLQMQKEIEKLEKRIKNSRRTNFKNSSIKNLKIIARALQGVAPYVVAAGIVTGGFIISGDIPFYPNDEFKVYSHVMTEFDNLGNIRYEQQYQDFSVCSNTLAFNSKWQLQNDGFYSRVVKTYGIKEKTYEEIIALFNKEDLKLEDIFGEPISTIKETKNNLSEDEIAENPFFKAVIYDEDKNDYIMRKETIGENIVFSALYLLIIFIVELPPAFFRHEISDFDFYRCLEEIKEQYRSVDVQELKRKLEIRYDNYNRMTR